MCPCLIFNFKARSIMSTHYIAELQIGVDNRFNNTLLEESEKLNVIQKNVRTLNESLSTLNRKLKTNSHQVNLKESYRAIENAREIWESLQAEYPDLSDAEDIFLTTHKNLEQVSKEDIERLNDTIRNMLQQEQGKIPLITQMLKLATDLNDILSRIIQELAKDDKRSRQTPINNMRA